MQIGNTMKLSTRPQNVKKKIKSFPGLVHLKINRSAVNLGSHGTLDIFTPRNLQKYPAFVRLYYTMENVSSWVFYFRFDDIIQRQRLSVCSCARIIM